MVGAQKLLNGRSLSGSAVSQEEPAGVDRVHAVHLDDAIRDHVGVRVQLDEGIGAVGEPVDLARRRELRGIDEDEVLIAVAGHRVVGIHVGEVEKVAFRTIEVDDDVRVVRAALGDRRPQEYVAAPFASQRVEPEAADDDVDPIVAVTELSNSLPTRLIAAVVLWSAYSTSTSDPAVRA